MTRTHQTWSAGQQSENYTARITEKSALQILAQVGVREYLLRYNIAILLIAFGVAAVIAAFSPQGGDNSPIRMSIIIVIASTCVPSAYLVSTTNLNTIPWSVKNEDRDLSGGLVFYSDVAIGIVLLTIANPVMALVGGTVFAVVGAYVAHFASDLVLRLHLVYANALIIVLAFLAWRNAGQDFPTVLALTMLVVIGATGVVAMLRSYATDAQQSLATQHRLANTDSLTGTLNRRGFIHWTTDQLMTANAPISIVLIDLDHYKELNDEFGHAVGDVVLTRAAMAMIQVAGPAAVVARVGGDEFAVAMVADLFTVMDLTERIRERAHDLHDGWDVTFSIGSAVAHHQGTRATPESNRALLARMIGTADFALFHAKESGRNTTWIADLSSGSWYTPNPEATMSDRSA